MYAIAADLAGSSTVAVDVAPPHRVAELKAALICSFPKLSESMGSLMVAVNADYADDSLVIPEEAEIACIPPVSGGSLDDGSSTNNDDESVQISITDCEIDYRSLTESVRSPRAGAVVTFLGTAREFTDGKQTESLEYEAYQDMALSKLREVAEQARNQWPFVACRIEHRVGPIALGEIAISIAVSCPHRSEAFAACQFIMDTIKKVVPIWKKECWSDGSSEWIHPGMEKPSSTAADK